MLYLFLPGKRVAICSMRNSCNADLIAQEAQLRDFDVIWLDDHLDEIIVPKESKSIGALPDFDSRDV